MCDDVLDERGPVRGCDGPVAWVWFTTYGIALAYWLLGMSIGLALAVGVWWWAVFTFTLTLGLALMRCLPPPWRARLVSERGHAR